MNEVIKVSSPATREYWEIPVLHEDADLLALDKPASLLTSPDRHDPNRPNLMGLLHRDIARQALWAQVRGIGYLANAHRLDFETSGLLLLARNKPALIRLADLFGSEKPIKRYLALVQGAPPENEFEVDRKLGPHPSRVGVMHVDERGGKRARTAFRVLERFQRHTLLECFPIPGRPHQIRAHLQYLRFSIVGDPLYGGRPLLLSSLKPNYRFRPDRDEKPLISRVALHSAGLEITHPATGKSLEIVAPWPKDLTVAVKYLRRYCGNTMDGGTQPVADSDLESPGGLPD
jgi:RluA family pseudouridine synthase